MATETVIGVVFSAALAAGSLMATGDELLEALLGGPLDLGGGEVVLGVGAALLVVGFILWQKHRLVIALVSPDMARTSGVKVDQLELVFLLAFALAVALGLRYLGVLLMGSLVIIPAATAKQLTRTLNGMLGLSAGLAVFATFVGEVVAARLDRPSGPIIIAVAATLFFLSLALRRRR